MRAREKITKDRRRGVKQHYPEEKNEKNREVVVSRTPGGGRRGRVFAAASQRCDDANRAHAGHVRMLATRPSEQLAPQKPRRKDTGTPWARRSRSARCRHRFAYLHLRKDKGRQGASEQILPPKHAPGHQQKVTQEAA